jgi:hypothetical protein
MSAWPSLPPSDRVTRARSRDHRPRRSLRAQVGRLPTTQRLLADEAVVFVFEGSEIEGLVRDLVNDRASSAEFAVWAPLLQGTPVLAREEFYWQAGQPE